MIERNYGTVNITYNQVTQTVTAPPEMSDATIRALVTKIIAQSQGSWQLETKRRFDALSQQNAAQFKEIEGQLRATRERLGALETRMQHDAASGAEVDRGLRAQYEDLSARFDAAIVALAETNAALAKERLEQAAKLSFWYAGVWHLGATFSYESHFASDQSFYVGPTLTYDVVPAVGESTFRALSLRGALLHRFGRAVGGFVAPSGETLEPYSFTQSGYVLEFGPALRFAASSRFEVHTDVAIRLGGVAFDSDGTSKSDTHGIVAVPLRARLSARLLPWLAVGVGGGAVYDFFWVRPVWTYTGIGADSTPPEGSGKFLLDTEAHVELTI